MTKPAEGGGFGAADYRSYTFILSFLAWFGVVSFTQYDLGDKGHGYLHTAFGFESSGWVWVCLVVGWFAATLPNQQVSVLYTTYTGRLAYGDDRIGYARSGGRDVAAWSGFFSFVGVVCTFAFAVPPGFLFGLRPLTLLVLTACIGVVVARFIARRLFFALYGEPRYSFDDVLRR